MILTDSKNGLNLSKWSTWVMINVLLNVAVVNSLVNLIVYIIVYITHFLDVMSDYLFPPSTAHSVKKLSFPHCHKSQIPMKWAKEWDLSSRPDMKLQPGSLHKQLKVPFVFASPTVSAFLCWQLWAFPRKAPKKVVTSIYSTVHRLSKRTH